MEPGEIINSTALGSVIVELLTKNLKFKDSFKSFAPNHAADIESAATNPNCSCRSRIKQYVDYNRVQVGTFLSQFANENNIQQTVREMFASVASSTINIPSITPVAGKVAKTSIKDWPGFVESIQKANFQFNHMSTSVVGEDVYVFFA